MANPIQLKRGLEAGRTGFTALQGEPLWATDTEKLWIGDGATAGGIGVLMDSEIGTSLQAWDAALDDISGLAVTDGNIIVGNGTNWVAESGATARASLGLTIGTDVQPQSARLAEIAALAVTDGNIIVGNGSAWVAESGATARTSLGLGTGDSPAFTGLLVGASSFSLASAGMAYKQVNDTFAGGLILQRRDNLTSYSLTIGTDNNLYIGYAPLASGADDVADFTSVVYFGPSAVSLFNDLDLNANDIIDGGAAAFSGLVQVGGSTPASAAATGTAGTVTWDASYIYVCTAANTWKRVAIATW